MDDYLRNQCKYLKCYQGISYKEIAEYLEIRQDMQIPAERRSHSEMNGMYIPT